MSIISILTLSPISANSLCRTSIGLADVRELSGAADEPDLPVDRHAVGLRLGDQLLGLLGIVRPQLQLVVVSDDARRDQLSGRLTQPAEQRLDDAGRG